MFLPIVTLFAFFLSALLPAALRLTHFFIFAGRLRPGLQGWGFAHKKPPSGHHTQLDRAPRLLHRDRWKSTFSSQRDMAFSNLVSAIRRLSPPWLVLFFITEWFLFILMDLGATCLNYRTTAEGAVSHSSDFLRATWVCTWVNGSRWTLRRIRNARGAARHFLGLSGYVLGVSGLTVAHGAIATVISLRHLRTRNLVLAMTALLRVSLAAFDGTILCGLGRFLALRFVPIRLLLLLIRVVVRVLAWQRALVRSVRLLPRWANRAVRMAPHALRVAALALTISLVYGWALQRPSTCVAPLPRARPQGTTAAVARAGSLAGSGATATVVPRSTLHSTRRVGFALRSSSLRAPKLKARDAAKREPWRS